MFNNLEYVFDAETGDIVPNKGEKMSTKVNGKKRRKGKRRKAKKSYQELVREEIDGLSYDKNFIKGSFVYMRVRLLRAIESPGDEVLQKDLDGLYLANFLTYRKMLDDGLVNLELLKEEREYLQGLLDKEVSEGLKTMIREILGYISFYFSKDI